MKCIIIILFALGLQACSGSSFTPNVHQVMDGKASYVIDGETFYFSFDHGKFKTRIANVRVPRINEKHGRECFEYLRELIHQKNVRIEYLESDNEGRWLANAQLATGEDIGKKVQAYCNTLLTK